MKKSFGIYVLLLSFITSTVVAQNSIRTNSPKYQQLKKEGKLKDSMVNYDDNKNHVLIPDAQRNIAGVNQTADVHVLCNCMLPIDTFFHVVPFDNYQPPDYRNDDGSSPAIALPFNFCLYGTTYNTIYINNNGNISFNAPYNQFSPVSFPTNQFFMVAPFWGDVDTEDPASGLVYYKITATHLVVRWDSVGYYNNHIDKRNTFQLIITDGNDPILPPGKNVDFCYGDMNWTTGDASLFPPCATGGNGFGGCPATVGANSGNGVDYIQFGRFNGPGTGYDGPFGLEDSVDFLDGQNFIFNTCTSGGITNIPPVVHGFGVCDSIILCVTDSSTFFVDTIPITLDFLSPEQGQITTITPIFTGLAQFTVFNNIPGAIAHIDARMIVSSNSYGLNAATFIATDNGTPPASDTLVISYVVDTIRLTPPSITGSHFYCTGGTGVTLSVPNTFTSYLWSTGTTGTDTLPVLTGTYNVEVTDRYGCTAKSPAFPVWEITPSPIIGGITAVCGQNSAHLTTTQPYTSYLWSNSQTNDTIIVGTGTYSVSIVDSIGCIATSPPLTVDIHSFPDALFSYSPLNVVAGDTVHFTDLSTAGSGSIVEWLWDFGDGSTSNVRNPNHAFANGDSHPVSLTVTQADGCSKTYLFSIEPTDIIASNILTPNNDGKNDIFYFKHLEFYPDSKLTVFNRWGKKVFEDSNYKNDWKGGDLTDGVYYYIMKIPGKDDLKGTVTIKK